MSYSPPFLDSGIGVMQVGYDSGAYEIAMDFYGDPLTHDRFQALCDTVDSLRASYDAIPREALNAFAEEELNLKRGLNRDGSKKEPQKPTSMPTVRPGYVYLAKIETGQYKIGRSVRPEKRIKHFDTKMPVEVSKVHAFFCDDYVEAEKRLHGLFEDARVTGEWFEMEPLWVAYIRRIDAFEDDTFWAFEDEDGVPVSVELPVTLEEAEA